MARRKPAPLPPMPDYTGEWTAELAAWVTVARVRASNGDEAAAEALYSAVREHPGLMDRWRGIAETAEDAWLNAMCPDRTAQVWERLTFQAEANRLRKSLLGDAPTPIERLLVDRIVVCQLAALWAEHTLGNRLGKNASLSLLAFYGAEADRHHRRLLKATEALARVRRMQVPVQVNLALGGGQQVNVGQMAVSAGAPAAPLPEGDGEPIGAVIDADEISRAAVAGGRQRPDAPGRG